MDFVGKWSNCLTSPHICTGDSSQTSSGRHLRQGLWTFRSSPQAKKSGLTDSYRAKETSYSHSHKPPAWPQGDQHAQWHSQIGPHCPTTASSQRLHGNRASKARSTALYQINLSARQISIILGTSQRNQKVFQAECQTRLLHWNMHFHPGFRGGQKKRRMKLDSCTCNQQGWQVASAPYSVNICWGNKIDVTDWHDKAQVSRTSAVPTSRSLGILDREAELQVGTVSGVKGRGFTWAWVWKEFAS